jgi:hypothetical protein
MGGRPSEAVPPVDLARPFPFGEVGPLPGRVRENAVPGVWSEGSTDPAGLFPADSIGEDERLTAALPLPQDGRRRPERQRSATPDVGPDTAAGGEDDLDMLATKIQLILQEEARRHGIDV